MKLGRSFSFVFLITCLLLVSGIFVAAEDFSGRHRAAGETSYQERGSYGSVYSSEDLNTYWPVAGKDRLSCDARQDLILAIPPGGCQPSLVRSDLLAEQNVPVFCKVDALQINPFVDIKEIRSIGFATREDSEGIASVGFHPARAALRSRDRLLGSPVVNNLGYVVVVLQREEVEDRLPDFVETNLTARINYDSSGTPGVGRASFVLGEIDEQEWREMGDGEKTSFWQGRYFVRLERLEEDFGVFSIYSGEQKIQTLRLRKGESSGDVYVPGSYCQAALSVTFEDFRLEEDSVLISVRDDEGEDVFEVYEGGRFLDGRCIVRDLDVDGAGTGKVSLLCRSERVDLEIKRSKFFEGDLVDYNGQRVSVVGVLEEGYEIAGASGDISKVSFDEVKEIEGQEYAQELEFENKELDDKTSEYYELAMVEYYDLAESYGFEGGEIKFGEQALANAFELSIALGQDIRAKETLDLLEEKYPESIFLEEFRKDLGLDGRLDRRGARKYLELDNRFREIGVVKFKKSGNVAEADLIFGKEGESEFDSFNGLTKGQSGSSNEAEIDRFRIEDIESDFARLSYSCEGDTFSKILRKDQRHDLCEDSFVILDDLRTDRVASVRINPVSKNTGSEAFLNVKVGIEKRAIDLSPNRTAELIESLDEKIADLNRVNEKLGRAVEGLKAACLATGLTLNAKNFLFGLDGSGLARKQVLNGPGGWKDWCEDNKDEGETLSQCLARNSGDVESDVSAYARAIERTNDVIERIDDSCELEGSGSGIFGKASVNRSCSAEKLIQQVVSDFGNEVVDVDGTGERIADVFKGVDYDNGDILFEELREAYTILVALSFDGSDAGVGKERMNERLGSILERIKKNKKLTESFGDYEEKAVSKGLPKVSEAGYLTAGKTVSAFVEQDSEGLFSGIKSVTHVATLKLGPGSSERGATFPGGLYVVGLERIIGTVNEYNIKAVASYAGEGSIGSPLDIQSFLKAYEIKKVVTDQSFIFPFKKDSLKVRYYETEPYKGMPAIVPLSEEEGWYVATRQSLPTFGKTPAYESSGRPASFWICNVGPNGRPDVLEGVGDDRACTQFNLNSGQPLNKIGGLSESKAKDLVNRANRALTQAADQYGPGVKFVVVNGERYEVGSPATDIPGVECEDFMSSTECSLLYNVCDPVVCPSSRCNFGGKYHVPDVIQSGVVGSALLCLPNFGTPPEGVLVPVCLSGVHAGLDSYVSIMQGYRECLAESLETGRSVGICDQIHSIYMCDLFWRQAAPLAESIVPTAFEFLTGQDSRQGGGEYLTVQDAWSNAQGSFEFFTQQYAVNSLNSFRARSTEGVGGTAELCKAFVSTSVPDTFESLVEPDSPPQVYAWFSSVKFSDVTVPATAQYKVFYHVFAGKDSGVQYQVYLKGAPESSFFTISDSIQVPEGVGFIPRGEFVSETKDFTAPEGYRELCVRVNDKDHCGFGQATTDFALNFVRDELVQEELTETGIESEDACVSGGLSAGEINPAALLNPNLQAGVEDAITASQAKRGIVRICASDNPGLGTDPGRFTEVGHCGNTEIRCWLDKTSIDNALSDGNVAARAETLEELEEASLESLLAGSGLTLGDAESLLAEFEEASRDRGLQAKSSVSGQEVEEKGKGILNKFEGLGEKLVLNEHSARYSSVVGKIYELIARAYFVGGAPEAKGPAPAPIVSSGEPAQVLPQYSLRTDSDGNTMIFRDGVDTGLLINEETTILYDLAGDVGFTDVARIKDGVITFSPEDIPGGFFREIPEETLKILRELDGGEIRGDKIDISRASLIDDVDVSSEVKRVYSLDKDVDELLTGSAGIANFLIDGRAAKEVFPEIIRFDVDSNGLIRFAFGDSSRPMLPVPIGVLVEPSNINLDTKVLQGLDFSKNRDLLEMLLELDGAEVKGTQIILLSLKGPESGQGPEESPEPEPESSSGDGGGSGSQGGIDLPEDDGTFCKKISVWMSSSSEEKAVSLPGSALQLSESQIFSSRPTVLRLNGYGSGCSDIEVTTRVIDVESGEIVDSFSSSFERTDLSFFTSNLDDKLDSLSLNPGRTYYLLTSCPENSGVECEDWLVFFKTSDNYN